MTQCTQSSIVRVESRCCGDSRVAAPNTPDALDILSTIVTASSMLFFVDVLLVHSYLPKRDRFDVFSGRGSLEGPGLILDGATDFTITEAVSSHSRRMSFDS